MPSRLDARARLGVALSPTDFQNPTLLEIFMQQPTDTPKLSDAYAESLPASRALYDRAKEVFPDGVTHDNRRMQPFPIYIERAEGAYKWDVDGNRYIDYWMGHGALLVRAQPAPTSATP